MSATAETDNLRAFFEEGYAQKGVEAPEDKEAQASNTGEPDHQEMEWSDWSGISSDDERDVELQAKTTNHVKTCYVEGRQYEVTVNYTAEPVLNVIEKSLIKIFQINREEPMPGDVLVFFHGRNVIESLESLVNRYAREMDSELPKLLVLPLFAALPPAEQERVFKPAPRNTRKIILATNIAESSFTQGFGLL